MKKILLLSLVLGLTASLYGCGIKGPLYIEDENATENAADSSRLPPTDAQAENADEESSATGDAAAL